MANTGNFVSYLRVSTDKQGRSGLGLEAQRQIVAAFLNGGDWRLIKEFVEVESGRKSARPELAKAVALARLHKATLVVAKLDRLARNADFLSKLREAGVPLRFCDFPDIAGATGEFMIGVMAHVAQLEAGLISERTKAALGAAKARGRALGGYRGVPPTDAAREASKAALAARTAARANDLRPTLEELKKSGVTSLSGIARELTARGIPTPRGGAWSASQVSRALAAAKML